MGVHINTNVDMGAIYVYCYLHKVYFTSRTYLTFN